MNKPKTSNSSQLDKQETVCFPQEVASKCVCEREFIALVYIVIYIKKN